MLVGPLAPARGVRCLPLTGNVGGPPAEPMDFKVVVRFGMLLDPPQRGAFAPESSNRHHTTVRAVQEHIPSNFHRTPGADD
ncbi:hypothetical protein A5719_00250 [Mycolicibacterium peregrinum]|nr:hypothetical protein A5719_00250 [Mycolicibacterium peregrinum]